ncbi:MAG: metalloregulator ArsR/SmtB family transcription factor [Desulfobacterales bacterium]
MTNTEEQTLDDASDRISQTLAGGRTGCAGQCRLDAGQLQSAAFVAKSLADGNRLRILLLLSGGKKSVSAIVEELGLLQPLVSHHLKELKRSLLVTVERAGPFIYYELADERILEVIQTLNTVATDLVGKKDLLNTTEATQSPWTSFLKSYGAWPRKMPSLKSHLSWEDYWRTWTTTHASAF